MTDHQASPMGEPLADGALSQTPHLRPTRPQALLWLLVVALLVLLVLRDFGSHPAVADDSSRYIVLAQSLLRGDVYGLISRAGWPLHATYPFGFPLVLAPFVALFPGKFDVLRVPSLVATVLSATLIFWGWPLLGRRSYWWGLGVTTLFCLSPLTMLHGRLVLSEAVFTAFLLGSLLLVEWGLLRRPPAWWYAALGTLLTLMVFTRSAGWAMLAGIVLYLFYRMGRHAFRRLAGITLCMAFCVVLVLSLTSVRPGDLLPNDYRATYTKLLTGEGVYSTGPVSFVSFLRMRVWQRMVLDVPSTILPGIHSGAVWTLATAHGVRPLLGLLGMLTTALLALGFVRWTAREGISAFLVVVPPYALALLAWDWAGPRFLYPIQGQLAYAFLLGLEALLAGLGGLLCRRRTVAWQQRTIGAVVVAMAVGYCIIGLRYPPYRDYTADLEHRASWLRSHTRPDAIVMSNTPEADYLYSARSVLEYPDWLSADATADLAKYLVDHDVTVLVVQHGRVLWEPGDGGSERRAYPTSTEDVMLALAQNLTTSGVLLPVHTGDDERFTLFVVSASSAPPAPP